MDTIKALRNQAGLSQTELAMAVGVTQGTVSQWESGSSRPRTELLPKIAQALHCSIGDLFAVSIPDTQQ